MPQANRVQNEPSMEEILASIRRIIEESDPSHGGAPKAGANDDVAAPPMPSPTAERMKPPAVSPPEAAPDLQGREVDRLADDLIGELETEIAPAATDDTMHVPSPADTGFKADRPEPGSTPLIRPSGREDTSGTGAPGRKPIAAGERSSRQPDRADAAGKDIAPPKVADASDSSAIADRQRAPILSAEAGRQVASAFEELSAAFQQSRRRSFDEIAEEMMRPMLQEWLDNNLPVLVERLVREEIDRVARGGSR